MNARVTCRNHIWETFLNRSKEIASLIKPEDLEIDLFTGTGPSPSRTDYSTHELLNVNAVRQRLRIVLKHITFETKSWKANVRITRINYVYKLVICFKNKTTDKSVSIISNSPNHFNWYFQLRRKESNTIGFFDMIIDENRVIQHLLY